MSASNFVSDGMVVAGFISWQNGMVYALYVYPWGGLQGIQPACFFLLFQLQHCYQVAS